MIVHYQLYSGFGLYMNKCKENGSRIIFAIAMVLLFVASFFAEDFINNNYKDKFAYYASVITIIALLVSIFEIINSIRISKSIKEISDGRLNDFKSEAGVTLAHECINLLDKTIENISSDNYSECFINFKIAKKMYSNISSRYPVNGFKSEKASIIFDLEKRVTSLRNATLSAGPNRPQQKALLNDLISVKQEIESHYVYKNSEV